MGKYQKKILWITLCFVMGFSSMAYAESDIEVLKRKITAMQEQFITMQATYTKNMAEMQARIHQLEQEKKDSDSGDYHAKVDQLQRQVEGLKQEGTSPVAKTISNFNPKISAIADFTYKTTDETGGENDNDFNFRELELSFSASVDTYARGDFFVTIEKDNGVTDISIEEGFLTLLETPLENLQGKFGKFRPDFGKANRYHLHNMPWVDYPKVVQNFFGEEGFNEEGVSLDYLIPNPWDIYS